MATLEIVEVKRLNSAAPPLSLNLHAEKLNHQVIHELLSGLLTENTEMIRWVE